MLVWGALAFCVDGSRFGQHFWHTSYHPCWSTPPPCLQQSGQVGLLSACSFWTSCSAIPLAVCQNDLQGWVRVCDYSHCCSVPVSEAWTRPQRPVPVPVPVQWLWGAVKDQGQVIAANTELWLLFHFLSQGLTVLPGLGLYL